MSLNSKEHNNIMSSRAERDNLLDVAANINEEAMLEKHGKNAMVRATEAGAGASIDVDEVEEKHILDMAANMHETDKLEKYQATQHGRDEQEDRQNTPTSTSNPTTGTIQNAGIREIVARGPEQPGNQGNMLVPMAPPPPGLNRDPVRRQQLAQPGAYAGGAEGVLQRNTTLDYELVGANSNDNDGPPVFVAPPQSSGQLLRDDQLAVANPVTGDAEAPEGLMRANPVDMELAAQREQDLQKERKIYIAGLLWIVLVAAIIMGFVIAKNQQKESEEIVTTDAPSEYGSVTPSEVPSSAPTAALDSLLEILPNFTLESLKVYDTPQWKAFDWLSNHPNVTLFPAWKKKQVFAMATLFYSMEGEDWYKPIRDRWLDYNVDECEWFSNLFGYFWPDGTFLEGLPEHVIPPCNQLGQFMMLELFQLRLQDLKPSIPPEISLLTSLSSVRLPLNGIKMTLSDFLPSTLSQTSSLAILWLAGNKFSGQIPSRLGMMTQLTTLALHTNMITGPIPTEFGLLRNLENVDLSANSLTGDLPNSLLLLSSLTSLYLGSNARSTRSNQLTGHLRSDIGRLTKLDTLDLAQNLFTGSLQSELGFLTSLEYLWMQGNLFTGAVPSEVEMMTSLISLRLQNNMMTGTLPISELQPCTNLERLQIGSNHFSGSIPSELGELVSLEELDLSNLALLTGSIPSEIGRLTLLTSLNLGGCSLTGTIPTEVGLLMSLEYLYLHNNGLTGSLPQQLSESMGLRLDGNLFTGTVPDHLCSFLWCDCSATDTAVSTCVDLKESPDYPGRFPSKGAQEQDDSIMFNYHTDWFAGSEKWAWLGELNETDAWETLQDGAGLEQDVFLYSFLLHVSVNTTYKLVFSRSNAFRLYPPGWISLTSSNHTVLYSVLGNDGVLFTEISFVISVETDGSLTVTRTVRCDTDLYCDGGLL